MRSSHLKDQALERARRFLAKRAGFLKDRLVSGDLDGIRRAVVIPVLSEEKSLFNTLAKLACNSAEELAQTLVICVVNNRVEPLAGSEQVADNQRTLVHLEDLVHGRSAATQPRIDPGSLRLAYVDASSPGCEIGPKMGVGEGRRIGLDLGLSVFTKNGEDRGILICLDADTLVETDYLDQIQRHFDTRDSRAAVVGYAHTCPADVRRRTAIVRYELFLRYHELGLRSARSPYAFPTIGSTIVARCDAYVAAGGMNRRQAGEDFYFLQELAKTGSVSRIDATTVHPSARSSDRVPFGTGATVGRHLARISHQLPTAADDAPCPAAFCRRPSGVAKHHRARHLTALATEPGEICGLASADDGAAVYHPESYSILGAWLSIVRGGLDCTASGLLGSAGDISPHLREFLELNAFGEVWPRLQQNAAHPEGLERQFYRWFDAFKTLKLIHFLRDQQLSRLPIFDAVHELLDRTGPSCSGVAWNTLADDLDAQEGLLEFLRRRCAADEG
ncbi:MAG: glycosyltransferase family 2 protein [Thermoanaerobaculales bacterium]